MASLSRREFLRLCAAACLAPGALAPAGCTQDAPSALFADSDITGSVFVGGGPRRLWKWSKEASHYRLLEGSVVVCDLCPHSCKLSPGDRGVCRSRVNHKGTLYTLTYGNPCSVHIDPIEKKPLFHFMPQTRAFSIAAAGCNLRCLNCQNWEISQVTPEEVSFRELLPCEVVHEACRAQCASIAYTYSEPVTFFEYMLDTARAARERGIANLWISNGYINRGALLELCGVLDAANVNLKAFDDEVYRRLNGGRLAPVKRTLVVLAMRGVHLEITTLVVPGYTDGEDMLRRMCGWILGNLGQDRPLHLLRFFPHYRLDRLPPTPVSTLERLRELAIEEGMRYVYLGNVPGHPGTNTYCHNCGRLLVERRGYLIPAFHIVEGRCRFCRSVIPGVWKG